MTTDLFTEPQPTLAPVRTFLDLCDTAGVTPAHLTVNWPFTTQETPKVHAQMRTRTDFEAVTKGRKTGGRGEVGCRHYWTADDRDPLIEAASFPHHDDYEGINR